MSSTGVQRVLHGPHSDPINSNVADPVPMDESECQAYDSRVKKIYLEDLREYIAGMEGSLGDGWRVEFKYCDKRCKTYAVYEGPNENVFESRDEVARHLGLHHSCSSKSRKSGANCSSPGSSFFHNGGSCSYQTDDYPVQFEDFFIISAGNVDPRPSYHSNNEIWPVGYSSCWHDRITGSILFCEVADGGDPGPVFKVRRYPCEMWPILVGSTVLSTYKSDSQIGEGSLENDNAATSELIDEESIFIEALLLECSPPDLSDDTLALDSQHKFPVLEKVNPKHGNICPAELEKEHRAGEFLVKGKSVSSVWELVSQTLQLACTDAYKEKGVIQFCCTHYAHNNKMDEKEPGEIGTLSRFSYLGGPSNFPRIVHSPSEFKTACEMLDKWLCQDRFGFDSDFVQEIIEQLPGVSACYNYKLITTRKHNTTMQTVGSGFLLAKREHEKEAVAVGSDIKGPCPSGKPLTTKIPMLLIGDAIQVWEFWLRFSDVLGLEAPFSFEEIEEELVSPWKESTSSTEMAGYSQCSGLLLAKIHGLLLKALLTKLLSEVAVYIYSHSGAGGSAKSSRRGREKDAENLAFLEKTRLEMLPINAITWPEVARRYMLALLSMEVDLESAEIACREGGKFFHCLQGDGGTLCGSLTGVAALEADALFFAEATKKIFGSPKSGSIFVAIDEKVSDAKVANDGQVPEWAKVLEPVRKLPTNVGSRIRKCVNEALEKNPPEWARKILVHSISKDVYKGNASGPTKRAVVSVLDNITLLKPEKEEKVKSDTSSSLSDLITKQCRIILRRSVKEDKDKVFCNLLGRMVLNPNDNDDEGLLGHPAMVSRPLDFRTVDLRLAAGSYGGSHESFLDDVREVWHNIRTAYCNDSDLLELAEFLLQKFEDDYKNEVLSLVNKIECSKDISLMSENAEVRDELFVRVNDRSIPEAPWEEEICKVCGVDKDDSNVLLCDGCDSEYHIYCLDPPLINVLDGKWYCPPCKATVSVPQNTSSSSRVPRPYVKKRLNGKNLTHNFMEALSQLTRTMELKEYWELSLENRIFLLKFLCDEVLNSPILCDHIDQKASKSAELQQKLHILGAELRLWQCREEILTTSHAKLKSNAQNSRGVRSDVLASSLQFDDSKLKVLQEPDSGSRNSSISGGCRLLDDTGNQIKASPDSVTHLQHQQCRSVSQTHDTSLHNEVFISVPQQEIDQTPENYLESAQSSSSGAKYVWKCSIPAEPTLAQAYLLDITAVKNQIRTLEDSIAAKELELCEVSVRKDCLGLDSNGRAYWTFGRSGSSQLLANSSMSTQMESSQRFWPYGVENSRQSGVYDSSAPWENMGMPTLSQWSSYKSEAEIEKLLGWLRENDTREKVLKESILKWRSNNSNKESMPSKDSGCGYDSDSLVTRAITAIKKKIGGCLGEEIGICNDTGGFYRCDCLEPLWPSRPHCVSCHLTFPTAEEHVKHGNGKCKISAIQGSCKETSEPPSKRKKLSKNDSIDVSHGSESKKLRDDEASRMNKKGNAPASGETQTEQERPFNFEEIKGKFIIPSSLKELVKEIGLIGCNGTPSFVSCTSPYLSNPALKLVSKREDWVGAGKSSDLFSIEQESQNVSGNPNCTVNGFLTEVGPMSQRPNNSRNQLSFTKDKMVEFIPGSSLLPLVGRASVILRCLRINLLDIDAALPEEALRVSRSQSERRCAWRAFVKSASTIYEMVLATIILEDAVKTDYLRKDWWYWSSPSAAARISTLSGLALRVYALDSAVLYDKLSCQDALETDYKEETEPHNSDPLNAGSSSRELRTC